MVVPLCTYASELVKVCHGLLSLTTVLLELETEGYRGGSDCQPSSRFSKKPVLNVSKNAVNAGGN